MSMCNPPVPACQGPPGCGGSSISFTFYFLLISIYLAILLSLLTHTFLLSHIAIDPQSENPISQLTVRPPTPQAPKTVLRCPRPPWCLSFSGPQDPPIRVVKHKRYDLPTQIRVVKPHFMARSTQSVWHLPHFHARTTPMWPNKPPDGHNVASIQANSAQHDSKWPSDSPTWPHMVPGYTKMPSRQPNLARR